MCLVWEYQEGWLLLREEEVFGEIFDKNRVRPLVKEI